jgi:hypothetical protein
MVIEAVHGYYFNESRIRKGDPGTLINKRVTGHITNGFG